MTANDLDSLEGEFGVRLPDEYREIMQNHPMPNSDTATWDLCDSPEELRRINRELREEGFFGGRWESSWWAIGSDGLGNHHFILTAPYDGRVYFADHEGTHDPSDPQTEPYPSFEAFIQMLREIEEEAEKEASRLDEKIRNRRWWQFWIPRRNPLRETHITVDKVGGVAAKQLTTCPFHRMGPDTLSGIP